MRHCSHTISSNIGQPGKTKTKTTLQKEPALTSFSIFQHFPSAFPVSLLQLHLHLWKALRPAAAAAYPLSHLPTISHHLPTITPSSFESTQPSLYAFFYIWIKVVPKPAACSSDLETQWILFLIPFFSIFVLPYFKKISLFLLAAVSISAKISFEKSCLYKRSGWLYHFSFFLA